MAQPRIRPDSVAESLIHIACAIIVFVVVYVVAGLIAEGAIGASRYLSG